MKVRKQKLVSMLLCAALTVTNIVSEGFQVSANELLPEQRIVVEDSTETESEMLETQASEAETGGNFPSEETDSTENEKDKETETETKEEETETCETESGLDEIGTETTEENSDAEETEAITEIDTIDIDSLEIAETAEEEAYPNALIPFEIGGTDIFAGIGSASFYSVNKEQPKYDPRTEAPEEMTSVKDQNPWGTCWSFAVMETLENSMVRQGLADNTIDLSERHLAYFAKNSGSDALENASDDSITSSPSSTYLNSGGNAIRAAVRLMNWQGAAAESKYEYSNANTEPAALSSSAAQDIEVMAHDIYFIPTKEAGKEEKISAVKKLIAEYGCVAWSYKHLDNCYNKENAAYYCTQKGTNHAITVVGWDDDFPAEKFSSVVDGQISRPAGNGAWIVKNSWGSDWGEDGYFYISYEDGSLGSGNPAAVSVAASKNEYDHNYFYGNTASLPESYSPYFKVSQVYQVKNEREQLKAVSALIYSDQADYSIQIYKNPILEDGVVKEPESGEPMLQTPETGKTGYTGLYTIDLSEPVIFEKGDYISIVIDFSRPGLNLGSQYAYLYTDESSTDSGQFSSGESYTVVNSNVTHEGQSFYCTRKTVESGWVWYDAQAENFNFRINALTVDTDQPVPVKAPVFDPEAGIIEEGQSVTIKADNDAEIYYTLDGSEPTAETGMKYSKPLEITEDVTIKAAAVKDGAKSKTAEAVYKYYKMKLVLSETEAELAKAGTHQLEVLQKPTAGEGVEKQVSWESSDSGIVTVSDNGVITGVSEGTAVITAVAEDYKGNMVTASCQVTVTEADHNIASGSYEDITWVIDADGKLTVTGTGDFSSSSNSNRAPWYEKRESITSAEINVTGMTNTSYMFCGCERLTSLDVSGFATENVTDMSYMFFNCRGLTSLDVSGFVTENVTSMYAMFYNCERLTSLDVSGFVTENVTNMNYMFYGCKGLTNLDVRGFATKNVKEMAYMFCDCKGLTSLDVSSFVTRSVTNMDRMFCGCGSLTSIDLSSFDTRKVTDMGYMFAGCSSLASIDMNSFATGNDANIEMMFYNCSSLTSIDLSSFNTSSVTKMNGMFYGCSSLTSIDLNGFDTRSITDMRWLFEDCSSLTSIDVSSFDTSSVTSMQSMFYNCSSLVSIDVSNFDTSSVTDMDAIFLGCSSLTSIDVGNFDTSSVTNMSLMFYGCSSLESIDMSSFSASSATNMDAMFSRCSKLLTLRTPYNLKLSVALPSGTWYQTDGTQITELPQNLDHSILIKKDEIPIVSAIKVAKTKTNYVCGETINVDDLTVTYYDADSVARELEVSDYTTNADKIDMSTVGKKTLIITYHDGGNIFTDEIALTVTLENIIANGEYKENGNNITWIIDADGKLTVTGTGDFSSSRANDRAPWYENRGSIISAEINVTDMVNATGMFYRCENLTSVDLSKFNTGNVTDMYCMFSGCSKLTSLDLSNFDTSNVIDMGCMFQYCSSLTHIDVSNFDTSNVISMWAMFDGCSSLTSLDVSSFDTSHATTGAMFKECSSLTNLDVSGFDTSQSTRMDHMFDGCSSLTSLDVSGFDTSRSTLMRWMFFNCSSLTSLDLSNFDTSQVTDMDAMLSGCSTLMTIHTPCNLTLSVSLPRESDKVWYDPDGTEITELPQNLNHSIIITQKSATSDDNIASGSYKNITWVIDADGKLTVEGTGDFTGDSGSTSRAPWYNYRESIKYAEVNVTGMTNASNMFIFCDNLASIDLSKFDTSQVTNMNDMFYGCSNLTSIDLSKFDTGQVTDMRGMFSLCSNLSSLDLSNFNTSKVTDMELMFHDCNKLTDLDVSGFDTSQVTNMHGMFYDCSKLASLDVGNFDTSQVTDMSRMFSGCNKLTSLDVSSFNTGQVTDMSYMFYECQNLTSLDLSGFATGNVTRMNSMFYNCSSLTSLDLSSFDISRVEEIGGMFDGCSSLTTIHTPCNLKLPVSLPVTGAKEAWYQPDGTVVTEFPQNLGYSIMITKNKPVISDDIASGSYKDITWVIDADGKLTVTGKGDFSGSLNSNRAPWYENRESITSAEINVTGMTDASYMFYGCKNLMDINMDSFSTENVSNMEWMFRGCEGLVDLDVSGFATDNVTDMSYMFSGCKGLTDLDVSGFVTDNVIDMGGMFHGCEGLTSLDVSGFVTDNVTDMSCMFNGCEGLTSLDVSGFVTDNVIYMYSMFDGCKGLTSLDVSDFATDNVTYMSFMFDGCEGLTSLDVSGFTTDNVISMLCMFSGCGGLTSLDVSGFTTDNVTSMGSMFSSCEGLTSLDVSGLATDNVTDMSYMFSGCKGLTSLDVSGFATGNVTRMDAMFSGCGGLTSLDVGGFATGNITMMDAMFEGCSSLVSIDISNFDVGKVKYIRDIFIGCSNLTTIYTPCNLKQSVSLPTVGPEEAWYQPDGTAITELPQNLSYSIIITKKQQSVTGSLSAQKIKTAYNCGEELELNDLTVTYTAENGADTEVTDYTTNAAEIDMSTPGIKTLAITYEGITVELELIVTYLLDEGTIEIILPDETYIYDGTAKQPEPIVTAGKTNTKLTSGKDYTLSYENNIDAGTAFMIITGQNDYQGTLKSSFRINKAAAPEIVEVNIYTPCDKAQEGQTFDIAGRYGEYGRITGYEIKDIVEDNEIGGTVFAGMPYIQDGILYYGTNIGKGGDSAAVTVEVSFANYESALLNVVVEFTDERAVYTVRFELAGHGQAIAPVTVLETGSLIDEPMQPEAEGFRFMGWYKDQSCTEAWDFDTDTVQDNITLYAGWLVEAAELEGADLYIQEIQNQIYTGSALKPSIRVYAADGDTRLKEGKDYTIKYFNNKNADQPALALAGGTSQTGEEGDNGFTKNLAYVIIKGKGNYKGTIYRNFHIDAASIAGNDGEPAKGFTLKYKEQLLYNASKAQKPFQSIRYKKSMKAGTDYELKLSALEAYDSEGNKLERGNVIADADSFVPLIPAGYKGTFLLTITGLGNYKGSIDKTVCVTDKKHLLKNATVSMGKNCKSVRYTGEVITLRPAYYNASQKKYYAVDNDGLVSTQAEPDGNNVFVVKAGGKCLKYGEDYMVSYTNNQAVGTATMTISGKGEYLGSKDVTFRITGMAFNEKNISVDGFEASMEYTGKPLTQNGIRLKSMGSSTENSIELTYGKDYTVNYKNNLKKGTATMTFTANPSSGYTGRFKKTFKITAASLMDTVKVTAAFPLEDCIADGEVISLEGKVAYEKAGAKPSGRIRLYNKDGILLKEGIDYSVSYAYNKVVTTADTTNLPVMNLQGKGNYTGSLSVNFRITEASMEDNENLAVTAAEVAFYKNKADNYTYQPKITVMDGKDTLNSRTDYTVRYERCTQAEIKTYLDALQRGRATEEELEQLKPYAVIEAKEGNGYVGSIRKELTVYRTKLTGNNLYIVINADTSQITYTGEQVKPEVTVYYGDSKAVKKAKNRKETREKVLTDRTGDYCLTKLSLKISENGIGDYTLSYGTNVTAGKNKGNVTVIGTGLYGGRVKAKFTINSKDVYTASK